MSPWALAVTGVLSSSSSQAGGLMSPWALQILPLLSFEISSTITSWKGAGLKSPWAVQTLLVAYAWAEISLLLLITATTLITDTTNATNTIKLRFLFILILLVSQFCNAKRSQFIFLLTSICCFIFIFIPSWWSDVTLGTANKIFFILG